MERIGILLSSDSVENSSRGQSASHMNITHWHCELQVTERLIYFVFSEIRENQIPGDRIEELGRDLCMGPQAVPQIHGFQGITAFSQYSLLCLCILVLLFLLCYIIYCYLTKIGCK